MLCLESALRRSHSHRMQSSFKNQVTRLLSAGYPEKVVTSVEKGILQKAKGHTTTAKSKRARCKMRPEVVPYVLRMSHNLKKVANRFGVPLVFSAPRKLGQVCFRITGGSGKRRGCTTKRAKPYVDCVTGGCL